MKCDHVGHISASGEMTRAHFHLNLPAQGHEFDDIQCLKQYIKWLQSQSCMSSVLHNQPLGGGGVLNMERFSW